jgi:hypothetical protein
VLTSSPTPPRCTDLTIKSVRGQGVTTVKTVKLPLEEATPSVVTASTGIDDSHASRYKAIFEQTDRVDRVPRNDVQNDQTIGHDFNPDTYIDSTFEICRSATGILLHPSNSGEAHVISDDEHYSDVDNCLMNQNGDSSTEECTSTNALIVESNVSDNFSASETDTDSLQSSMTDDIRMDDSKDDSTVIENKSSPPMNRISALTEAIAMKQSDIAVQFCSMIQRMTCIVEKMDKMQNANDMKEWKMKSRQYTKECQALHKTATKMAKKQVLLAHQSTKYVERLEQELLDLQSSCQFLHLPRQMPGHLTVPEVIMKQPTLPMKVETKPRIIPVDDKQSDKISETYDCVVDDERSSTTEETKFGIQEVSFCNSIVIDIAKLGAAEDGNKQTDNGSGSFVDSGDASALRFLL